jgi:serine/threonine-protein phosphatase 2A regulatory subunit B
MDYSVNRHPEFRYKTEFQSHEPEVIIRHHTPVNAAQIIRGSKILTYITWLLFQFDYLKSLEIEEKINKIKWCQTANGAVFLLSTNDKTIKFWKVWNEGTPLACWVLVFDMN